MDRNLGLLEALRSGDAKARDTLCQENMGLVWNVVKKFSVQGVDSEDLAQTGMIGLLKAIDNFDESFSPS